MKKIIFLLATLIPAMCLAQQTRSGDEIEISQAVNEDLYIVGGTITVNAPIRGDLVIGGGTVVINDTIAGDVIAGGGKITINGYIGDDLRGAGGDMYLNGEVSGDVVLATGTITAGKNSLVHGNMLLGSGTAVIAGTLEGNMTCRVQTLRFSGNIKKDAGCRGEMLEMNGTVRGKSTLAASQIKIGKTAAFYQYVSYWQNNSALDFGQSMKYGDALYEPALEINNGKWQYLGFVSVLLMLWYLASAFVLIFIIQYFFGKTMSKAAEEGQTHTVHSLGYGFLFLITIPVASVILMMTLIGLPLGILLLTGYLILLLLASVISSVMVANRINQTRNTDMGTGMVSLIGLVVFILLKAITLIPVLGWLIMLIVCSLTFGALITILYQRRQRNIPIL